jgi:hypothetical protein
MLKLDFDIIYDDIAQYKECWLCNETFKPEIVKRSGDAICTSFICMYCMYGVCFQEFVVGRNALGAIGFYGNTQSKNAFIIHRDSYQNNKLKVKFPVNLDNYIKTIERRLILL